MGTTQPKVKQQDVREIISNAAMLRFESYGYNKTTMAEIAEDCAMSAANLYRYFTNKQEIAAAVTQKYLDERCQNLERVIHGTGGSAAQRLENYFLTTLNYTHEMYIHHKNVHEFIDTMLNERIDMVHKKVETEVTLIAGILEYGNKTGEFFISDIEATAISIRASLVLFDVPVYMGLYPLNKFEKIAQSLVHILVEGLAKR